MISIEKAIAAIQKEAKTIGTEKIDIVSSLGRVLAQDIRSKDYLPPFDKSAMDGYAIKSQDSEVSGEGKVAKLEIAGLIKAGDYHEGGLQDGQAMKIMTGAALPKGADCVIQIEKVEADEDFVTIFEPVKKGTNVIMRGEEIRPEDLALEKSHFLRPCEIGLMASLGYSDVEVYKAPVIAILITGDELVDIKSPLSGGKIRNSNEYSLKALIKSIGAECMSLGIIPDDRDILREKMKYALEKADIVITSGGASVGDYDFVDDILAEIGADIKFTSIAIKPGKPVTFATFEEKLFFGLPGNPSSIITSFENFIKPAVRRIMGQDSTCQEEFEVILEDDFKGKPGRRKYIYASLEKKKGKYYAKNTGSQCSNHLMTMSRSNGVVIIPEDKGKAKAQEVVNGKFIFR